MAAALRVLAPASSTTVRCTKRSGARRARRCVAAMANEGPSAGYAAALMELATQADVVDKVHADLDNLAQACKNAELAEFLNSPVVPEDKKKAVLSTLASDLEIDNYTKNFLYLLVDKARINILEAIVSDFEVLYCEKTNTAVATVTSAIELEAGQQALIAKKVQSMTGARNIKLKPEVDESLIGGFVLTLGNDGSTQIDLSIRGKLEEVERQLSVA